MWLLVSGVLIDHHLFFSYRQRPLCRHTSNGVGGVAEAVRLLNALLL